jgi:RHS repeat-associated protein
MTPDGIGDLIAQTTGTDTTFVLQDGQGSNRITTNNDGTIREIITFDAFGNRADGFGHNATDPTNLNHLYVGEHFDSESGFYHLRARDYDPAVGRFTARDEFEGAKTSPVSKNLYLYANADPINFIDPSGHISMGAVGIGIGVGAILGAMATPVYNYAIGKATTIGDVAMGALIGATLGGAAMASPIIAGGLAVAGLISSGAMVHDVYLSPDSTQGQKVAATALMLAAVAGPAYASRYAGAAWGGGRTASAPMTLSGWRAQSAAGVDNLAAMYRAHGFIVRKEVYVRNPYYKVGRRYDLVVEAPDGKRIAIEWKATYGAVRNQPINQVRADAWIEQHGGTMFGKNAGDFAGKSVNSVIVLFP